MLSKILENKILLVGVIAIAVFAIFAIANMGDEETGGEPIDPNNESFIKITKRIDEYEVTKKWNKYEFNSIKNNTEDLFNKELINEAEKTALLKSLTSKHISLLNDSLVLFCKNVNSFADIGHLEKDVKEFKQNISKVSTVAMEKKIENYKTLKANVYGANSYVAKKKYNDKTFKNYMTNLENFKTGDFGANIALQTEISNTINKLNIHKNYDLSYSEKSKEYSCDCKTEFKSSKFYVDTCLVIQQVRDNN